MSTAGDARRKMKEQFLDFIIKGNLVYDFTFANLAIAFLETNDSEYLHKISELDAAEHILNHAKRFQYDVPQNSAIELASHLLSPIDAQKKKLPRFKRNLHFAKENIAEIDFAQRIALQCLPEEFHFESSLFFTFGYDLGVVYGKNCSLNLANPYFLENMNEMKYYAIHELHHAGFLMLKNSTMPSLAITTYREMADLIAYFTHLEGMGTFAPLAIREKENAMDIDRDYIALQDSKRMEDLETEYFDIYFYFKNNPGGLLTEEDWRKVAILSDGKRLWYTVGANMAKTIDQKLGREKLVSLIAGPSENFITTYLSIKEDSKA